MEERVRRRHRAKPGETMKSTGFFMVMTPETMGKLEDISASRGISKAEMVRALISTFWNSSEQKNYRDRRREQEKERAMP